MIAKVRALVAGVRASPWGSLVIRSLGTASAVVALATVGGMPHASAHVQLPPAECPAIAPSEPLPTIVASPSTEVSTAPKAHGEAVVVLNTATVEQLQTLPGVGPKRAEAILALRTRLGRFKRVEDLLRVKGIGRASLRKLKAVAVVDAPLAAPENAAL